MLLNRLDEDAGHSFCVQCAQAARCTHRVIEKSEKTFKFNKSRTNEAKKGPVCIGGNEAGFIVKKNQISSFFD